MTTAIKSQLQPSTPRFTPLQPQKTTYFSRSVEQIDPNKIHSLERSSILWKVAAALSLVFYTTVAIGCFVGALVLAPIYTPITSLFFLLSIPASIRTYRSFMQNAENALYEAEGAKTIQKHYAAICQLTPQAICKKLNAIGIFTARSPERFKILLAKHEVLSLSHQEFEKQIKEQKGILSRSQASHAKKPDKMTEKDRKILKNQHKNILEAKRWSLETKIATAFINALMLQSHFEKYEKFPEDLYTFSTYGAKERALGDACNDPNAKILLFFKNKKLAPLTIAEAERCSIAELGKRLAKAF